MRRPPRPYRGTGAYLRVGKSSPPAVFAWRCNVAMSTAGHPPCLSRRFMEPTPPPAGSGGQNTSGAQLRPDATSTSSTPLPPPPVHRERRARHMGWRTSDILRAAAAVLAVYLLIKLLWFAYPLVFVTFLGVLFGLAVSSGVDRLERFRIGRFRIPRGAASALIVFGFIALLGGFVAWTAPILREQSQELRTKLPEAIDNIDRWIASRQGGMLGSLLSGTRATAQSADALTPDSAAQGADAAGARSGAQTVPPEPPKPAIERASDQADSTARGTTPGAQRADSGARAGAPAQGGLRDRLGGALSRVSTYL